MLRATTTYNSHAHPDIPRDQENVPSRPHPASCLTGDSSPERKSSPKPCKSQRTSRGHPLPQGLTRPLRAGQAKVRRTASLAASAGFLLCWAPEPVPGDLVSNVPLHALSLCVPISKRRYPTQKTTQELANRWQAGLTQTQPSDG